MIQPSTKFIDDIRAYQIYALNYGHCPICDRGLSQGEKVYVGYENNDSLTIVCENCKSKLLKIINYYIYHPKEFYVPNKETKLWRYQDFPKFVSILDSGKLFFTRADKFEDTFEGARGFNFQRNAIYESLKDSLTIKVRSKLQNKGIDNPTNAELDNEVKNEIEELIREQENKRKDYFVSCWHTNDQESEAMWKLYISAKNQGVAIQTTMERLCYSIGKDGFEIGRVNYISYEKPLNMDNVPVWYKRNAFRHEDEVRVIFKESNNSYDGLLVDMDLDMLIDKIYISPSAPSWFALLVDNVMKRYGLNKKVEHSKLDEKPIY